MQVLDSEVYKDVYWNFPYAYRNQDWISSIGVRATFLVAGNLI